MAMIITYEQRDPRKLKVHPVNATIYGEEHDPEFIASCEHGIYSPLLITADDTVFAGHERLHAAIHWKQSTVPVIVRRDLTDPLDIRKALILSNKQREKTVEQKAREYSALSEIETEKAKQRMASGKKPDPREKVPEGVATSETGRAKSEAAAEVGFSRPTADKAAAVVAKIDEATASGDTETADKLRDTLNNESVAAAAREAGVEKPKKPKPPKADREPGEDAPEPEHTDPILDSLKGPVPESLHDVFAQVEDWKKAMTAISTVKAAITALVEHPASAWLDVSETDRLLTQARTNLKFAMPYTECPKCRRKPEKKCPHCKGLGWLPQTAFTACASDADKAWLTGARK